ncbi:cyclodeaminase/cyclohydrolase family protein [soil metagenome]
MKLTDSSVSALLAAFRSFEPTPGGGSASALAGAVGASLLAMVAGLPKPKGSSADEIERLTDAGTRCTALAVRLQALIDEDSEAYDLVLSAFRLPKATDAEKAARTAAIQQAMTAATEAPLQVMRHCAEALAAAPAVAELGNPNAASDVHVALEMLKTALRGAQANVDINLGGLKDAEYVARVRAETAHIAASV